MRKIEKYSNFLCSFLILSLIGIFILLFNSYVIICEFKSDTTSNCIVNYVLAILSNKCCGQVTVCLRMKMRDVRDA